MASIEKIEKELVNEKGIYFSKNLISAIQNRIPEDLILLILKGGKETRIGDWMNWEWFSTGIIGFDPNSNSGKGVKLVDEEDQEIKGYLAINKQGNILDKEFANTYNK